MFAGNYGYHLHRSGASNTPPGCGRGGAGSDEQVRYLARLIDDAFRAREAVTPEVV